MQNELMEQAPGEMDRSVRRDDLILLTIAAAVAVVHMATNGRYGFHRDELQTLSDALYMDWGFVAYPPFTPLVERLGLALFGPSLVGLRIFSVAAQSAAIFITGLMARELGGGGLAQASSEMNKDGSPHWESKQKFTVLYRPALSWEVRSSICSSIQMNR
jgi:hypothetical protein